MKNLAPLVFVALAGCTQLVTLEGAAANDLGGFEGDFGGGIDFSVDFNVDFGPCTPSFSARIAPDPVELSIARGEAIAEIELCHIGKDGSRSITFPALPSFVAADIWKLAVDIPPQRTAWTVRFTVIPSESPQTLETPIQFEVRVGGESATAMTVLRVVP